MFRLQKSGHGLRFQCFLGSKLAYRLFSGQNAVPEWPESPDIFRARVSRVTGNRASDWSVAGGCDCIIMRAFARAALILTADAAPAHPRSSHPLAPVALIG